MKKLFIIFIVFLFVVSAFRVVNDKEQIRDIKVVFNVFRDSFANFSAPRYDSIYSTFQKMKSAITGTVEVPPVNFDGDFWSDVKEIVKIVGLIIRNIGIALVQFIKLQFLIISVPVDVVLEFAFVIFRTMQVLFGLTG